MTTERMNNTGVDADRAAGAGAWALWASAFVLAGLLILRLSGGAAPGEPVAWAEMSASEGEYHLMTTDNGNEELLYVVDNREEMLFVYVIDSQSRLVLLERQSLPTMFRVMRARSR